MSRVRAFRIDGLRLQFRANDHEPPHFHAVRPGEWEVRVDIRLTASTQLALLGEVGWSRGRGVPARYQEALCAEVVAHRDELMAQWEREVVTDAKRNRTRD